MTGPRDASDLERMKNLLIEGSVFLKYGTWGEPGKRLVRVTEDLTILEWRHLNEDKSSGFVLVSSLMGVKFGRTTGPFKRRPVKRPEQDKLSFTIIGNKRNLDLEAETKEQMDTFLEALVTIMKSVKRHSVMNLPAPPGKVA